MNSWRMDLAVLTDLSASMFVACFMILLIFLSLVQGRAPSADEARAGVEAMQAFRVVRRGVPSSAAMVEQLRLHRNSSEGVSIDVFADRVVVGAGGQAVAVPKEDISAAAQTIAAAPPGPARLYVFSNETYLPLVGVLAPTGRGWSELSVPQRLRDEGRPDLDWAADFVALEGSAADPQAFRAGLATLLDAGPSQRRPASGAGPGFTLDGAAQPAASDLLASLRRWLGLLAAMLVPAGACVAVVLIERERFRRMPD